MNNRDVNQEKKYFCDKTPLQEYLLIFFSDGGNLCVTKWYHLFCFCFLNNPIQEAALKMKKTKTAELLNGAIYSNWKNREENTWGNHKNYLWSDYVCCFMNLELNSAKRTKLFPNSSCIFTRILFVLITQSLISYS